MVKMDRAKLMKRGVKAPNLVETGNERLKRLLVFQCALEVAWPQLVFLRVEVFLAALPDRPVLIQLVTRVRAPRRAQRGGEHCPDREHSRAALLQALVQDVRGI